MFRNNENKRTAMHCPINRMLFYIFYLTFHLFNLFSVISFHLAFFFFLSLRLHFNENAKSFYFVAIFIGKRYKPVPRFSVKSLCPLTQTYIIRCK